MTNPAHLPEGSEWLGTVGQPPCMITEAFAQHSVAQVKGCPVSAMKCKPSMMVERMFGALVISCAGFGLWLVIEQVMEVLPWH